jgi:hypothetical protein
MCSTVGTMIKDRSDQQHPKTKRLIVRVEPELVSTIKHAAKQEGRTVSNLLRRLAIEHLQEKATAT